MPSLKQGFDRIVESISGRRSANAVSFEPIYYLVYPSRFIRDVNRQVKSFKTQLEMKGWRVFHFSMLDAIWEILENSRDWDMVKDMEKDDPLNWDLTNAGLHEMLIGGDGALLKALEAELKTINAVPETENAVLLITGLEALHTIIRPGFFENKLHSQFNHPAVFFYPGETKSSAGLKFLGFYPEDGNYRSEHISVDSLL